MLAELYHSPSQGVDNAVGTSTLGSSEAIMLAGLAMKKRWQARMEAQGKPTTKPNLVMGYNVQVHAFHHWLMIIHYSKNHYIIIIVKLLTMIVIVVLNTASVLDQMQ